LPVFGLGWLAARIDIKHLISESRQAAALVFQGPDFLLNEQPDKAIEAFIEVVRVDPETIRAAFRAGEPVPARVKPSAPSACTGTSWNARTSAKSSA